ncbi:LytTR family DNA-binding domain-containing protein [Sinanaerobacter chloroacetimidivorans]|jgi:DNA-binding LytR/AlgR family response regulator|uniref:LytTR family transcriptional regulator DNA-binding domain-containing protein n=1 Tax=Sinanaerobacter chloroacetimidivorans TaxID=2818044 RepID=A0A8J7W7M1_9FIRM|nr:LytTR family DNA-binding domain-containing protein [Sinanaerobacter chloroacetimidivorans]MBR0600365.1 LytTR family transcriptional regulator DNA-binding domain-containing protein [Sinanaerobacter chloroacetimidivorans]
MKIIIEEPNSEGEEEIIIRCRQMSSEILQLINAIKTQKQMVIGYENSNIHRINPMNIYYFEAVDNKVFIYCKEKVYESKLKLYEIEEVFSNSDFLRVAKSVILNIKKITYLSPAFSGRFEATLDNGEKTIISRQYVSDLKKKLRV